MKDSNKEVLEIVRHICNLTEKLGELETFYVKEHEGCLDE